MPSPPKGGDGSFFEAKTPLLFSNQRTLFSRNTQFLHLQHQETRFDADNTNDTP